MGKDKTADEIERERQKSQMIGRGAGHNEINSANQRAAFNNTGKTAHERAKAKGSGK